MIKKYFLVTRYLIIDLACAARMQLRLAKQVNHNPPIFKFPFFSSEPLIIESWDLFGQLECGQLVNYNNYGL